MPKSNANLALKGLDEMFSTEESRQEQKQEQVQQIPIEELFPFKEHPFKVLDDEAMQRTVESVAQYGVLAPLIARPRPEGGYEIISGHRRQHAAELAGLDTLPVIVREMTDDAAVILMVDSNLQRENILPSERAFAYKMKLEALKNQGARSDLTSCQVGTKFRADESLAEDTGESARNVQRFIRLTNLIPELLDLVDEKKISFNPAVELSYLDEAQQWDFLQAMKQFRQSGHDCYLVMQLQQDADPALRFASMRYLNKQNIAPSIENYEILYRGNLPEGKRSVPQPELLEQLYQKFNFARPTDYHGHSLSVSDVIMLNQDGKISAHYVDSIGFKELPGFLDKKPERTSVLQTLKEKCDAPECNPTVCRKARNAHEL
mgnify:CR=1 FL=1